MVKLNKVKERFIYLSPTVQAGWEDESNINDFEQQKVLGKGAFGKVVKCLHKKSKLVYAIKEIDKQNLRENGMKGQMINEVKIMYQLNHPHILKLYNHFEDDRNIYLVLELATGGQMYQVLWKQPGKRFSEQRAANYIFQLCLALEKCHNNNPSILHRDIKPENILLDANNQVKLADFGWSNFLPSSKDVRETFCGTLDYLAPEMLEKDHQHDCTVDIWSVGVLCYELLTGLSPFAPREKQYNAQYVDITTRNNIKNLKYAFPTEFPPLAKDLVQKILQKDTKQRLSLKEIMAHPWISQYCKVISTPDLQKLEMDRAKQIVKSVDLDDFMTKNADKAIFSQNEIYSYSRPDSIINKELDPKNKQSNFGMNQSLLSNASSTTQNSQSEDLKQKLLKELAEKTQKLEAKVNELSISNNKKNMEIDLLKKQLVQNSKMGGQDGLNNQELLQKLQQSEQKYQSLKIENDFQWGKLMEVEKKNRDLQAQQAHSSNNNRSNNESGGNYQQLYEQTKRQLEITQMELERYKKSDLQKQQQSQNSYVSQNNPSDINGYIENLKKQHQQGMGNSNINNNNTSNPF